MTMHTYERSPHSGAGNCNCGYARDSAIHPREFRPALIDPFRCVCSKPPNHRSHVRPTLDGER